jgi:hypothetical protein
MGVRETAALLEFTRHWLIELSKPLKTAPTVSLYRIVDTSDIKYIECHKSGHCDGSLEGRKNISDAFTALPPANVDILVQKLTII